MPKRRTKTKRQLRKTRSIRLSDRAWDSLEALAYENESSRGELLEIILAAPDKHLRAYVSSLVQSNRLRRMIELGQLNFH